MKWLLFLMVFGLVLTGFLSPSLAGPSGDKGKLSVGVKQPDVVRSKGTLPGRTEILEPKALSKISGGSVTLKWKGAEGASVYHVQVATDPRFKWMVTENHNVAGETFEVTGLEAGQQYFWRVAGRSPENDASWTKGYFSSSSFEVK